jgi:ketosteroid isomerase-like protein
MRRHNAVVLLLVVGSSIHAQAPKSASASASASVEQTLRTLSDQWAKVSVNRDAGVFGKIFADDFLYVDPSGRTTNKADAIADVARSTDVITSDEISNFKVRVYAGGTVAVTIGDDHGVGRDRSGKPIDGRSRFTNVWVLKDGSWQCVSGHSSNLPSK